MTIISYGIESVKYNCRCLVQSVHLCCIYNVFYFTDRISSYVTSNAAGSHHSLPPSHGGFDQAESHTIVLSDSDTQDNIEDYSPCDSEVSEHTEMQSEETAASLHNE